MKFGGSTIPSADRVKEIAELVLRFPAGVGCTPVLVLSAMGNTTSNLLLAATKALTYGANKNASELHEFTVTKDLHLRTIAELGLDSEIVSSERMSARIFSAYLNKLGKGKPKSFSILEKLDMLVNCVATSEGNISLVTVPSKTSSRELVQLELDDIVGELKEIAVVDRLEDRSVISLIGNPQMSQLILEKAFNVLSNINVKAQMISQASYEMWNSILCNGVVLIVHKQVMKLSLVVNNDEAEHCVQALHAAFFENGFVSEAQVAEKERPIPSVAASSSGIKKRKTANEQQPRGVRQERADTTADCSPSTDWTAFPNYDPIMPEVGGHHYVGVPAEFFDIIPDNNPVPVRVDNDGLAATGVLPQPQAVQPEQPSGVDANHGAQEYNKLWAFLDNDNPMPVRGDNGDGDPLAWFADILEPDDYPMFDDSGLDDIPMLNAEAEQQGRLTEAAEGGSPIVTEKEEVIEALIAGATPDKLFGSPSSDMSWPPPALASSSSLHVAGECQAAFCGLCFTEEIGI
ncbi:hypothetical protein ACQ4PT_002574 [Festuca glaucescens]